MPVIMPPENFAQGDRFVRFGHMKREEEPIDPSVNRLMKELGLQWEAIQIRWARRNAPLLRKELAQIKIQYHDAIKAGEMELANTLLDKRLDLHQEISSLLQMGQYTLPTKVRFYSDEPLDEDVLTEEELQEVLASMCQADMENAVDELAQRPVSDREIWRQLKHADSREVRMERLNEHLYILEHRLGSAVRAGNTTFAQQVLSQLQDIEAQRQALRTRKRP